MPGRGTRRLTRPSLVQGDAPAEEVAEAPEAEETPADETAAQAPDTAAADAAAAAVGMLKSRHGPSTCLPHVRRRS